MKQHFFNRIVAGWGLLMLLAASAHAGPIGIAFHDTTIVGGTQIDYPIYVDSLVTGLGVTSYQVEFTFNNSLFTFISARADSTLTTGWTTDVNTIAPGRIRVAGIGSNALTGKGKLVILRFFSNVFTYTNYGYFTFQSTLLNEGTPATAIRNGTVIVQPPTFITVSPNTALITKGDTKQFTVSGGKTPYVWSTTNPSVASINSTGLLSALNAGFTKVVCTDSSGIVDTSGTIEIRALSLWMRDTTRYQGQWLDLPIYTTDVTGLGIISGQFTMTYNPSLWTPSQIITTGTLLQTATTDFSLKPGGVNIGFSSSSALTGSGILLYVRMKATMNTYGYSYNNFVDAPLFNESFKSNFAPANVIVTQLPQISVTANYAQNLIVGDSVQFIASGGTAPYSWSVSDTSRASISSTGWLKAKKNGIDTAWTQDFLGATGHGGVVNIYDFRLSVPDTSLIPASTVDIPLFVTPNKVGFSSVQMKVTYTTGSFVQLLDVVSAGTLTAGWNITPSFSSGAVTIAAASANSVTSGGTLFKLHFAVPDSTPRPSTIYLTLSNVMFNEGTPLPLIKNGSFTIANNAIFGITPSSGLLQTTTVGQKDSVMFTVNNTGTATLTSSIGITGSSEFTLSTYNINVPASGTVNIWAYYKPVNAGADTATMNFYTNDPYHSTVGITLIGKVVQFPIVNLSATTFNFGAVQVGNFKDATVTITNTGTDTLKISNISANHPEFAARPTSVKIPPSGSVIDTLRFTPSAVSSFTGWFLVVSNASSSPDTIKVTGTGSPIPVPMINLSAMTFDFGTVQVGHFVDTTV
ncbi:MAG: choice-of-anchor D domain-containing protein, partial [Bacteroidota bacterium]|nr:choice-of-anchor D domain-containing protein [Bacteroidota bacterium]